MAHEIDFSNARANIAIATGVAPWHGYGAVVEDGMEFDAWRAAAGLVHNVNESPVEFTRSIANESGGESVSLAQFPGRKVLYRSDTGAPLGVVGKDFKVVQPKEVMDFFAELCSINGFSMEVAGSLRGGARIWGLAKVHDGAVVIGHDVVRPYVLLCTGYDGTLATHAKLTTVQVVCNNTLEMSVGGFGVRSEDGEDASQSIRVPHRATFDAKSARMQLGIAKDAFEKFMIEAQALAKREAGPAFTKAFLKSLLPPPAQLKDGLKREIEETEAFQRLLQICTGGDLAVPHDPAAVGSMWGLLSGVTYYVDHERGNDSTRLNSAWFGAGNGLKSKARDELLALIEG